MAFNSGFTPGCLCRLKIGLHGENIQLLQNKRKQFIQERDKVKEEVSNGFCCC